MTLSTFFCILASFPLAFAAFFDRKLTGTWLAPSSFFSLYWLLATLIPLLAIPTENPNPVVVLAITGACVCLFLGAKMSTAWVGIVPNTPIPKTIRSLVFLETLVAITTILGLAYTLIYIQLAGLSLSNFADLDALVQASNFISIRRYENTYSDPWYNQMLLPFAYLGPLLGGVLMATHTYRRQLWLAILALFPSILITIIQTTKASMVFGLAFWVSAYFSCRVVTGKLHFERKIIKRAVGLLALFLSLILFSAVSRGGQLENTSENLYILTEKLPISFFGHIPCLSYWFTEQYSFNTPLTWGVFTFAGIFDTLHLSSREQGLYNDFYFFKNGESSNVYGFLRGLVQDYTLVGAGLILMLVGFVGDTAYRQVLAGRRGLYLGLLCIFYVYTLGSAITSIFAYNSLTLALVMGLLFFIYQAKK